MAMSAAVTRAAQVITHIPWVVTKTQITITGDGSDLAVPLQGYAHGGPSGVEPVFALLMPTTDSGTEGAVPAMIVTNYDTTNDEVDVVLTAQPALGASETVVMEALTFFTAQASGGTS